MRKVWIIFKREYRAAVKTKSFIIGLIMAPILMGGSLAVFMLLKDKVDINEKRIAIIDYSDQVSEILVEGVKQHNEIEIFDSESGDQVQPAYILEFIQPDINDPLTQQLELSNRVRSKELHAFIEIGPDLLHPDWDPQRTFMKYYAESSFMDNIRNWFSNLINNELRKMRVAELELKPEKTRDLFSWIGIEGMGLVSIDKKTGGQQEAKKSDELQSFLVPYIIVLLMFMLVMMGAVPLLTAVMEEKSGRIAEVLLGSVTPFQFMMGKVLGGLAVSLTTSAVYVGGGIILSKSLGAGDLIPYHVLPWFFVYTILFIMMVGSGMAALGSACNDNKDAQTLQFPAMLPVILPLFILIPIIQNPGGSMATGLSLFPPFTPSLMSLRLATSVSIPVWQPITGLIGVILFTALTVWLGGRIFHTAILLQGQKPTLKNLIRYARMK